jgi:hypothetical protein
VGVAVTPTKADPPLVVDSNAPLPEPVSRQLLETVPGWNLEIIQSFGGIEHDQFPQRNPMDRRRELLRVPAPEDRFCFPAPETLDHARIITRGVIIVN